MGRQNGPGHASVINSHWAYRTRLYRIKCCSAEVTNSQQCREPRALFVYILALLCVQWLKRKWYDNVMSEMSDKCYCRNTTSWREGSGTLIFMTFLNSVVNLSHSDSAWSWKHRLNGSNASGVFTYLLVCVWKCPVRDWSVFLLGWNSSWRHFCYLRNELAFRHVCVFADKAWRLTHRKNRSTCLRSTYFPQCLL